jgi:hypothetical protein
MNAKANAATAGISHPICAHTARRNATELAKCGWLVELNLISERESDLRLFAVGIQEANEAEEAMLRYPGIVREDKRSARRRLSDKEIARLGLRSGGVRPYIFQGQAESDDRQALSGRRE